MSKLIGWTDVLGVVKTIIKDEYHLHIIDINDKYTIEKITDSIFSSVRKRELTDNSTCDNCGEAKSNHSRASLLCNGQFTHFLQKI